MSGPKKIGSLDTEFNNQWKEKFKYQEELTSKLDGSTFEINQEFINEVVLWKVNRYASVPDSALQLLSSLRKHSKLDEDATAEALQLLLGIKGIQLAMASTILRFTNSEIYQIIDQRVYRILPGYDDPSKLKKMTHKSFDEQAQFYIEYLKKLRAICEQYGRSFKTADREFYVWDKDHNTDTKISY